MDFHALPRRDLQALCKRNAIRANMSNAAMADALRSLQSVAGIDEIWTAPPPGMSAVKPVAEEKQRHGCPLPSGVRSQAATKKAAAHKTEGVALTPNTLQRSQQNTAIGDATAPLDAEAVSSGKRRTRRSRRSKAKVVPDQKEEETAAAQTEPNPKEPILFEKQSAVGEGQQNGCPLPHGVRGRATRSRTAAYNTEDATPVQDILQWSLKMGTREAVVPVEVEMVSTGKRRTRRSRRLKVKVALDNKEEEPTACMEPIEKRCDDPKEEAGMDEEATKLQEDEANYESPSIYSGKRRTWRSKRAKMKMALDKKEEVAVAAKKELIEKNCDDQKEEAGMDEEATKPQEDETNYENPSIYSGKGRTRRSKRAKVKMALDKKEDVAVAARKELIVVSDKSCDDFNEGQVPVKEVGAMNFLEGILQEPEPISTIQKSPFFATMKDSPIRCVLSIADSRRPVMEMTRDASVSESSVDEMTFKINPDTQDREDGFSLNGEIDQLNLLVNTLDKFAKPIYKFTVKEEKKQGECWWMLM